MFRQRVEDMTKAVRGNVVGLIVSSIVAPAAALDKSVAAGETWRVTAAESVLELDRLTLGDGARIEFAEDVERWSLNARQVRIGRDVVIDGRGEAGNAGAPGAGYAAAAPDCNDGKAGKPGGAGGEGSSGVDLSLNLGIAAIGSLSVVTDGGAGGAGGVGGAGQHGGDIRKCRGGAGGTGGEGGRGGDGGDAGELTLVYRPLSGLDTSSVLRAIQLSSEGGEGGAGGVGGVGGDAVEGRYMKGSFAGNKKWLAGGKPGARGAAGGAGAAGSSRNPVLQVDGAAAKSLRPLPVDDRVKRNSRIAELERRVEALEKRLRALEQDAQR